MSWFKGLLARTRSIAGTRTSESRMEEEFQFHVEMETKRLVAQHGLSAAEARRRALVAFGGLDAHREEMRDGRGARWFDDFGADVRYALRAMRRAPGFAIAVALTLGVGIGVNGIVFGYVDSLLFRPVPARDADALVSMFTIDAKTKQIGQVAYEDFVDFRDQSGAFDGFAGMAGIPLNVSVPGHGDVADMVWGELVTENFFTVLDMKPVIGRFFSVSDAPQGANPFAVVSYDGWMRRFGGDSSIVGRKIRINGTVFTVVGVAPRGFRGMRTFGFWPEVWVPAGMHDVAWPASAHLLEGRGGGWMMTVGRMRRGADRAQPKSAQRFINVSPGLAASNATTDVIVLPRRRVRQSSVRQTKSWCSRRRSACLPLVTLIICANLVNLSWHGPPRSWRYGLGCSRALV
jgi:hypothetical protein